VLLSADRVVMATARSVGKSKLTVWRWQERFLAEGLVGTRRTRHWCSRSTKKARFRRWTVRSPGCRSRKGSMLGLQMAYHQVGDVAVVVTTEQPTLRL
jgi:hypothetical protein